MFPRKFLPGKTFLVWILLREVKPDGKEGNMDEKETKLMKEQIAKILIKYLDQLFHDLEDAPKIILEAEEQAEENGQTINEIPA